MAKELVDTVREAELKAEQLEKQAAADAKTIIAKAHEEARTVSENLTKQAAADAENAVEKAKKDGEQLISAAVSNAEKEISIFNELVRQKKDKAIELVINSLI